MATTSTTDQLAHTFAWATAGLLAGAAGGVVASRIRRLEWDDQTSRVVARLDGLGAVILVGYIAAMLARDWVLGHWAEGPALAALGLSVTAGALAGQLLGTRRGAATSRHGSPHRTAHGCRNAAIRSGTCKVP